MSDMTVNNKSQIWSPRFDKPLNEKMKMFNQSILFDYRLAKWDIIASMAHAKMLEKVGLFTKDELRLAISGLEKILKQVENGGFEFKVEDEDVHYAIQNALIKEIGDIGKKIHTARSRNDQVATDLRLYTREHMDITRDLLQKLIKVLQEQSEIEFVRMVSCFEFAWQSYFIYQAIQRAVQTFSRFLKCNNL